MAALASVLQARRDYVAAEALYQEVLAIRTKTLGPGHHQVAYALLGIGHARQNQNNFEGAEKSYREALAIEQKGFGQEHQFVAEVLKHLSYLNQMKPLSFREQRMLERSRYLVVSELAAVCRQPECNIEPRVDDALTKACSRHDSRPVGRVRAAAAGVH